MASELVAELEACRAPAAQASTLPGRWYSDPALAEVERDAIFRRGWVGLGRHDRWAEPGDFITQDIGDVPVVVVRGDDGVLRAFANSCRHRSAKVMVGEGSCKRLRCPFHFWTYALDGRLVGAPSMQQAEGFDAADHGLIEFAVAEHDGFVFVSLEADPSPIADGWLAGYDDVHRGWSAAELVTARRREFTVDCNWKGFAEVFNEYYHLPYVHPDSIDDTYDEPDAPEPSAGAWATHFGTTVGTGGLLEEVQDRAFPHIATLSGRSALGVRYTWLFPNLAVAFGQEGLWMYEVYPDGPDRCRCAQVVCFPPETMARPDFDEVAAEYYERFDVALAEDIPMLVQQHAGLSSPFSRPGRYSHLEPSVAAFASWYAGRLLDAV